MLIIEHPQDRRARRTQDAIIAAAVSLILEKGADALTIRDITERADYNRRWRRLKREKIWRWRVKKSW